MQVAVLGYGTDGVSAVEYWHKLGAEITVCDNNTAINLPDFVIPKLGLNCLEGLDKYDVIVRSPGIRPDKITSANPKSPNILDRVTTTINEFFEKCPAPIIGVTGTKGKGTTSTLIYNMLTAAGINTYIGGNIGIVPLDFLSEVTPDSWVVLELSSFQLMDIKHSPKIGVCLMVVPEHQDWHTSLQEYYHAKSQLFAKQSTNDIAVFHATNPSSKRIVDAGQGIKIPYYVPPTKESAYTVTGAYVEGDQICMDGKIVCDVSDVALLGRHNLENVCAAIAAVWKVIDGNVEAIKDVVQNFAGLEHRLEFVREVNHVQYYNDSFATTPEATVAAIHAFSHPKIVILGGSDKGIPFYDVVDAIIHSYVRRVIIIGETGQKIIELLVARGYENITLGGTTMTEIVQAAQHAAEPGDVVILSTACASFDMFKDYKDRGNQFKTIVNALK